MSTEADLTFDATRARSEAQNAVRDLLRSCARLPDHADLDQVRAHAARMTWSGFPDLAQAHGLAPLAHLHLGRAGVSPPVDVQQQLFGLAVLHRTANATKFEMLGKILDAFEAESIRVLLLKGSALAHILYPSPGLRPTSDIDLLVDGHDAGRAQSALRSLGFDAPELPTDRRFVGHHHLPPAVMVQKGVFVQIEIHREALSRDTPVSMLLEGTYGRRQAFVVSGRKAYAFGHEDMLHHLVRHAAERSSLFRLIWVTDIVAYATQFHGEIDWAALRQRYPFVLNALSLLHLVTPLPAEVLEEVPVPRESLAGAGTSFRPLNEIVRSNRPAAAIVRELLSPGEWWVRFYYGASSRSSFLWHLWIEHPSRVGWWFARRGLAWMRWRVMPAGTYRG